MKNQKKIQKSNIYGIIGSIISCLLLFLLLWFVIIPYTPKEEDEGIMISFGDNAEGSGIENTYVQEQTASTEPIPQPTQNRQQELLTQEDHSVAIAEEERKRKEQAKAQVAEEQKRQEEQRKQEIAKEAHDATNVFGNNAQAGGSGTSSGETQQGDDNPVGKKGSGKHDFSLAGREPIGGELLNPPYKKDVEGKITVNIRVDAAGKVLSASVGSPSTISDNTLRKAATETAMKTRFTSGDGIVIGTITYYFKLN